MFISVFSEFRFQTWSWASWIQPTRSDTASLRWIFVSSHWNLCLKCGHFSSEFPIKMLYVFLTSHASSLFCPSRSSSVTVKYCVTVTNREPARNLYWVSHWFKTYTQHYNFTYYFTFICDSHFKLDQHKGDCLMGSCTVQTGGKWSTFQCLHYQGQDK